jgi:hypothetical protein
LDFIERIWGVSPDGGNGTFELMLLLLPVLLVLVYRVVVRRLDNGPRL